jgi:small-conductance mechanosensitive channel
VKLSEILSVISLVVSKFLLNIILRSQLDSILSVPKSENQAAPENTSVDPQTRDESSISLERIQKLKSTKKQLQTLLKSQKKEIAMLAKSDCEKKTKIEQLDEANESMKNECTVMRAKSVAASVEISKQNHSSMMVAA